jgi:hypothetical protein
MPINLTIGKWIQVCHAKPKRPLTVNPEIPAFFKIKVIQPAGMENGYERFWSVLSTQGSGISFYLFAANSDQLITAP